MKERPIIMTAESVRGILDGRKTQTRRVVRADRHGPWVPHLDEAYADPGLGDGGYLHVPYTLGGERVSHRVRCQHAIGDRLWVRETWTAIDERGQAVSRRTRHVDQNCGDRLVYRADDRVLTEQWRSPLFMPRWASRITLEVTAVRVERLQDITEEGARAEGVEAAMCDPDDAELECEPGSDIGAGDGYQSPRSHVAGFERAWHRINGKHAPWASNPWVFVITFRRLP